MVTEIPWQHPVMGSEWITEPPWRLSETPAKIKRHGPLFGEHNQEVYHDLLGLSNEEIKKLEEKEIIF